MQTQEQERTFDLEERTFHFARNTRRFLSELSSNEANPEDKKQLYRSSGSVAANYIEANEAVSRRDFALRIRISKKEVRESYLWLRLLEIKKPEMEIRREQLIKETIELGKIFGAILKRCE